MTNKNKEFDLEERLIEFAVRIINVANRYLKQKQEITLPANL